jgi:hypothetical protein
MHDVLRLQDEVQLIEDVEQREGAIHQRVPQGVEPPIRRAVRDPFAIGPARQQHARLLEKLPQRGHPEW